MPSSLDLILAHPLTALGVFLAAVAALWLCLAAGTWAAWVLGWFDWCSRVAQPHLALLWRETSELWGGESARSTGNARDPGRPGHGWAGDSLHPSNFNGRSAVHTMANPHARDSSVGSRPRSVLHSSDLWPLINRR